LCPGSDAVINAKINCKMWLFIAHLCAVITINDVLMVAAIWCNCRPRVRLTVSFLLQNVIEILVQYDLHFPRPWPFVAVAPEVGDDAVGVIYWSLCPVADDIGLSQPLKLHNVYHRITMKPEPGWNCLGFWAIDALYSKASQYQCSIYMPIAWTAKVNWMSIPLVFKEWLWHLSPRWNREINVFVFKN
jgi:hypothetical protein